MENASKALIIAGAILLSIILISLGIMVVTRARESVDNANLDTEQAQAFNTKISQYCGNGKSASQMNALMDAIAASNGAQDKLVAAQQHYIEVEVKGDASSNYHTGSTLSLDAVKADSVAYPTFKAGTTFDATYATGKSGYINKVTVDIK